MKIQNSILMASVVFLMMARSLFGQDPVGTTPPSDTVRMAGYVTAGAGATTNVKKTVSDDQIFHFALSPYEVIQGRLAGLDVSSVDGSPYTEYSVTNIRNLNFLSLSSPLVLIDGMQLTGVPLEMNPNDIESISFLKDGTHAGIYGGQAASGVLLINTKAGGDRLRVHYSGGISSSKVQNKFDVYGADEYRKLVTEIWSPRYDVSAWLGNANTDWQDVIYQTGVGHDHYLSLSGPVLGMPFYLSVGKTVREGVVKTSKYDRTTATLSFRPKFFSDHLSLGANVKGIFDNNDIANIYAVPLATDANPTQPVYDNTEPDGFNALGMMNPLAYLEQTYNSIAKNQWLGNISLDYKIHFLPDLKISVNYGFVKTDENESLVYDSIASWNGGYIFNSDATTNSRFLEASLIYSRIIDALSSSFGIKVGLSEYKSEYKNASKSGNFLYFKDARTHHSTNEDIHEALYGSFFWTLKERYTARFTLRQDGYSRYIDENGKGLFPSLLISWDAKKDAFLSSDKVFSALKIYTGYSITGNYQALGRGKYIMDPKLKPERISSFNLGTDFGFFNNRLYGTVEYYCKTGKDILGFINVPSGSSYYNYLLINLGSIKSSGIDLTLRALIFSRTNLQWHVGVNFIYGQNKTEDMEYSLYGLHEYYTNRQYVASYYCYKQAYSENGTPIRNVYEDTNGDGIVDENDRYIVGSIYPSVVAGLNSSLQYKGWDFSFSGRLHLGNYMWNEERSSATYDNLINRNCSRLLNESQLYMQSGESDYYVEKASFFRMDFISLGYKFPDLMSDKVVLRVSAALQNAFVITRYGGRDPEVANGNPYVFPRPRTAMLELSIDF